MNTRYFFISFLFFALSACQMQNSATPKVASKQKMQKSTTEVLQNQFEADIKHYLNSYNTESWENVIDMLYPPTYGNKTRDDLMMNYVQGKLMGMQRNTKLNEIEKVSKVIGFKDKMYAKIYYSGDVKVALSGEMLANKDFVKSNLELSYDTNDVVFDEKENAFLINDAYVAMLAISKKGSNIWQYIEVDKQKEGLFSKIIPAEVLNQLD
ncbi:MAG: hypothetical protein ACPG5B_13070 [Chitinophagales bacterium]